MSQQQINKLRFSGKTAIVTGAGSGIGKAAAVKLATEGANVALFDLLDDRTAQAEAEINAIRLRQRPRLRRRYFGCRARRKSGAGNRGAVQDG